MCKGYVIQKSFLCKFLSQIQDSTPTIWFQAEKYLDKLEE